MLTCALLQHNMPIALLAVVAVVVVEVVVSAHRASSEARSAVWLRVRAWCVCVGVWVGVLMADTTAGA